MKALPMLDHVMLWVARGFSVFLAFIFPYGFWTLWTDDDTKIIYESSRDISPYIDIGIEASFYGLFFSVWIVCVWHRPTIITKTLMGLSAAVSASWLVASLASNSPTRTAIFYGAGIREIIETLVFPGWLVLGLLSMVWAAFRYLPNSVSRVDDNPPAFAKPQSS